MLLLIGLLLLLATPLAFTLGRIWEIRQQILRRLADGAHPAAQPKFYSYERSAKAFP